jgi:phosphate-selective porin
MLRARLGILFVGVVLLLGISATSAAGATGPTEPVAPTTVPATTTPATTTSTTTPLIVGPVITAPPRGGAPAGTTSKPADEEWTLRQVGTTVGIIVAALAVMGFIYGRIRSTTPRRTTLARTSD